MPVLHPLEQEHHATTSRRSSGGATVSEASRANGRDTISLLPVSVRASIFGSHQHGTIGIVGCLIALIVVVVPWRVVRRAIATEARAITLLTRERAVFDGAAANAEHEFAEDRVMVGQADRLAALLETHPTWSGWFALIESYTLPEVTYLGFTADTGGSVALQATAANISTAAAQLRAFAASPQVIAVATSGISETEHGVRFDVTLRVAPEVFGWATKRL